MAGAKSYNKHCVIALVIIAIPLFFSFAKEDNKPNLVGIVITDEKPVFNWGDWFDGLFQKEKEDYNDDHWAFKEKFVRLNNQLYYKLFNQLRVNGFVSGKDNYVFSEGYIFAAYGDDLENEQIIKEKIRKLKVIQDTLKRKNIDLVLGLLPGKGSYLTEYIEDKYKHPVKTTNHSQYVSAAKSQSLNLLDFQTWFLTMKPTTKYPLFTKFGHHWSYYGECKAVDSTVQFIEKLRHVDMPDMDISQVEESDTARSRDADVLRSMNLLYPPKQDQKLAYPTPQFEDGSLKNQHKVLVIGDSYWYGAVYLGVNTQLFGDGDFWYYYNRVVPRRGTDQQEVWELDLKTELEKNEVILLMYADGNLSSLGSGFIDDAYELYTSPASFYARRERNRLIQTQAKQIRNLPALLKKSTKKSNDLMIPLDSAIKLDAMRMAGIK